MIDDPSRTTDRSGDDKAQGRFLVLQMLRLSGVALVVLGLLAVNGKLGLPVMAGYLLIVVGVVDSFILPALLARRWKSPLE